MLASIRPNQGKRGRRGIVLVLVLGMLALMALIGVTFATFSGQSRISARNFFQSMNQPQRDELMDYALSQLISDTPNHQSAIRGHSLARDMYGNDANFNGYLTSRPGGAGTTAPYNYSQFYIKQIQQVGTTNLCDVLTNLALGDSALYGYNFTRWVLRLGYVGPVPTGTPMPVNQTFDIITDDYNNMLGSAVADGVHRVFRISAPDSTTYLNNPSLAELYNNPSWNNGTNTAVQPPSVNQYFPFILDGRWLHAFNGPGMTTNAVYANFRYNQPFVPFVAGPNAQGMDEDYDAVDLENWFLAMQSADGSVTIPSFHRPSAIRIDSTVTPAIYDWGGPQNAAWENAAPGNWNDSASRILRPRAADGHDASAFPDLVPDATGKITYDVDNDGDGITDSVWVDLGYPARRNAQGQLYKPLFAFMVIGLNGRIPLNTAGNLAGQAGGIPFPLTLPPPAYTYGGGAAHAAHLGNSVSEVDPTYALQNGYDPNFDDAGAFNYPPTNAYNTQVDNAGIDVRLTQLRNLLAGTRPPQKTTLGAGTDGDTNYVSVETAPGSGLPSQLVMPNGVADPADAPPVFGTDASGGPVVQRLTPPVAGRWGEADSIPGGISAPGFPSPPAINNPLSGTYVNLVHANYVNSVRAGYSYDTTDILTTSTNEGFRDAADDNLNAFDPYPPGHTGELNDQDYYDAAGALILPVDRMRRYVTPGDINGTGSVTPWTSGIAAGADPLGRVLFYSYYRPPGSPGSVASYTAVAPPTTGAIYYPSNVATNTYFYTNGPNNNTNTPAIVSPYFLPDVTNNPLHGFEFFRLPPIATGGTTTGHTISGGFQFQFQRNGGMLMDQNLESHNFPTAFPTYDYMANASKQSDGLNDADEMNLYVPNPQADSPFGPTDLEWLYRQQDVDGRSLVSRLAQLAPVSFTNPIDGQRRRRLFTTDSWEMNNFAWANDNPGNAFPNNHNFALNANAGFPYLGAAPGLPTPSLAQRDKKINLNYPLPVSNDAEEPIRQKWISDAYELMKSVLPPKAVDTPDELAALSQFLVNVIDFRDPDCTMTHFRNPDVKLVLGSIVGSTYNPSYLANVNDPILTTNTAIPLDQYGMEYNPVAINEAMAYSFAISSGSGESNRFFVELVNTLSQSAIGLLPAGDFGAGITNPPDVSILDLSLANYDLVMTADDPVSRPDPFTGQLLPILSAKYYAQLPLNQANSAATNPLFIPALTVPASGDVQLTPLYAVGAPNNPPAAADFPTSPTRYFFVIGSPLASGTETAPINATATLSPAYDPLSPTAPPTTPPSNVVPPGYCLNLQSVPVAPQPVTTKSNTMPPKITPLAVGSGTMQYYWLCLRRPANPFAPPQADISLSTYNPMVVVDAMRFPYTEGGVTPPPSSPLPANAKTIISSQRCQPFRGGHAVRLPSDTSTAAAPLYTPYGYSEQMAALLTSSTVGQYGGNPVTKAMYHTLGAINNQSEPWDYFPFNDRDFTSVAELMLVPGCPPGLFTKQFVELAPMPPSTRAVASPPTSFPVPSLMPPNPSAGAPAAFTAAPKSPNVAVAFPAGSTTAVAQPHTYPYLVDKFFYSGYGGPVAGATIPPADPGGVVDGPGADGWFKMFEFFEVPSQSLGAIGAVAQGTNFDWARQDMKPGLLNLNLIIDEEVFFSVLGSQSITLKNGAGAAGPNTDSFSQNLLNFAQLPAGSPGSPDLDIPQVVTSSLASGAAATSVPIWGFGGSQPGVVANDPVSHPNVWGAGGAFNGMKAAFAQFLNLRHGGTGLLFSALPERPFHSLSYPDINYTVMRPATLPPVATTYNPGASGYNSATYAGDPGVRNPYIYPPGPTSIGPTGAANTVFAPGTLFNGVTTNVTLPTPIPARRLFQIPDAYGPAPTYPPAATPTPPPPALPTVSNASDSGDPFINVVPVSAPANLAAGALGTVTGSTGTVYYVNNGYPNLVWSGNSPSVPTTTGYYLGANNGTNPDYSQHPYWRSEMMQKVMNLTTVRTHQYAVWITIGFFEVTRQGDPLMANANPGTSLATLGFDFLGPEIGASSGQTTRYRGFFLVDRTKLYGFDDTTPGSFTPAVVYRQMIE